MVLFKFLPLFAPLFVWLVVRHPDFEKRRKRVEMLLVLMSFVVPVLLLIVHLIS